MIILLQWINGAMENLPIKRRAVVSESSTGGGWSPYGRVNRFINDEYVEVVDCTRHVVVYHISEIKATNYNGRWEVTGPLREQYPVFNRMPSMRKLKQMRAGYDKLIWKKNRKKVLKARENDCSSI